MKFKIGQIVKLTNNNGMVACKGATAKVIGVGDMWINVVWITLAQNQMSGHYQLHKFKLLHTKNEQLLFNFME